jgi:LysR family transcriptional regulator, nitrogen assimilation regulatory protein
MPTFTRCALAPALLRLMGESPGVEIRVLEAYSGVLTELVRRGDLDFAVVPALPDTVGLNISLFLRDREMLVSAKGRTGLHEKAIRLAEAGPLKAVLPGHQNTRRGNIESYFATYGVVIAQRLELDAMMGTLEIVRNSDWVAVLSSIIMAGDCDGSQFEIRPIVDPRLDVDFVLIEPARRAMQPAARLFANLLKSESERAIAAMAWDD